MSGLKKLLLGLCSCIMAGAMSFGFAACGDEDEKESSKVEGGVSSSSVLDETSSSSSVVENPYVGVYTFYSLTASGTTYTVGQEVMGAPLTEDYYTFTIRADGTGDFGVTGMTTSIYSCVTWSAADSTITVTANGQAINGVFADGKLTLDMGDGDSLVLQKSTREISAVFCYECKSTGADVKVYAEIGQRLCDACYAEYVGGGNSSSSSMTDSTSSNSSSSNEQNSSSVTDSTSSNSSSSNEQNSSSVTDSTSSNSSSSNEQNSSSVTDSTSSDSNSSSSSDSNSSWDDSTSDSHNSSSDSSWEDSSYDSPNDWNEVTYEICGVYKFSRLVVEYEKVDLGVGDEFAGEILTEDFIWIVIRADGYVDVDGLLLPWDMSVSNVDEFLATTTIKTDVGEEELSVYFTASQTICFEIVEKEGPACYYLVKDEQEEIPAAYCMFCEETGKVKAFYIDSYGFYFYLCEACQKELGGGSVDPEGPYTFCVGGCGEDYLMAEMLKVVSENPGYYCADCFKNWVGDEEVVNCGYCGAYGTWDYIWDSEAYGLICSSCYEEQENGGTIAPNWPICAQCNNYDENGRVLDGLWYCETCYWSIVGGGEETKLFQCVGCTGYFPMDEVCWSSEKQPYCKGCYESYFGGGNVEPPVEYYICNYCNGGFPLESGCFTEDGTFYCYGCYEGYINGGAYVCNGCYEMQGTQFVDGMWYCDYCYEAHFGNRLCVQCWEDTWVTYEPGYGYICEKCYEIYFGGGEERTACTYCYDAPWELYYNGMQVCYDCYNQLTGNGEESPEQAMFGTYLLTRYEKNEESYMCGEYYLIIRPDSYAEICSPAAIGMGFCGEYNWADGDPQIHFNFYDPYTQLVAHYNGEGVFTIATKGAYDYTVVEFTYFGAEIPESRCFTCGAFSSARVHYGSPYYFCDTCYQNKMASCESCQMNPVEYYYHSTGALCYACYEEYCNNYDGEDVLPEECYICSYCGYEFFMDGGYIMEDGTFYCYSCYEGYINGGAYVECCVGGCGGAYNRYDMIQLEDGGWICYNCYNGYGDEVVQVQCECCGALVDRLIETEYAGYLCEECYNMVSSGIGQVICVICNENVSECWTQEYGFTCYDCYHSIGEDVVEPEIPMGDFYGTYEAVWIEDQTVEDWERENYSGMTLIIRDDGFSELVGYGVGRNYIYDTWMQVDFTKLNIEEKVILEYWDGSMELWIDGNYGRVAYGFERVSTSFAEPTCNNNCGNVESVCCRLDYDWGIPQYYCDECYAASIERCWTCGTEEVYDWYANTGAICYDCYNAWWDQGSDTEYYWCRNCEGVFSVDSGCFTEDGMFYCYTCYEGYINGGAYVCSCGAQGTQIVGGMWYCDYCYDGIYGGAIEEVICENCGSYYSLAEGLCQNCDIFGAEEYN